jgi:hypothetical protein
MSDSQKQKWLLQRLFESKDYAIPRFAYQSTVNWMAALSILCESSIFSNTSIKNFYQGVRRRTANKEADIWTYENILMALHNVAALHEMSRGNSNQTALVRAAIISWYYSVYYSASAMIAAASGSKQETHSATAKVWHNDILQPGMAMGPFGLSVDTLVTKDVKAHISTLRNGSNFNLTEMPSNEIEAWGAVCAYLSGTAGYEREKREERIKTNKEFKKLGVDNFRTKAARELRDNDLQKGFVNFLTQAFRYRGKANYRDSIYLSYGEDRSVGIQVFTDNLFKVAQAFLKMACGYIYRRVEQDTWDIFIPDLEQNLKLDIDLRILTNNF